MIYEKLDESLNCWEIDKTNFKILELLYKELDKKKFIKQIAIASIYITM